MAGPGIPISNAETLTLHTPMVCIYQGTQHRQIFMYAVINISILFCSCWTLSDWINVINVITNILSVMKILWDFKLQLHYNFYFKSSFVLDFNFYKNLLKKKKKIFQIHVVLYVVPNQRSLQWKKKRLFISKDLYSPIELLISQLTCWPGNPVLTSTRHSGGKTLAHKVTPWIHPASRKKTKMGVEVNSLGRKKNGVTTYRVPANGNTSLQLLVNCY